MSILNLNSVKKMSALFGASAALSVAAIAQTTTTPAVPAPAAAAAATTQTTAEEVGIAKRISLSAIAQFNGPSLGDFDHTVRDESGNYSGTINVDTSLYAGYKFNDRISGTVAVPFMVTPIDGWKFTMEDISLRASMRKLLSAGNLGMSADLRAYLPTSTSSQNKNMITGIRSTQNTTYDIGTTNLTLGLVTFERINFFAGDRLLGKTGNPTQTMYEIYFGPNVNYQITPTLGANLLLEADVSWKKGNQFDQTALATDLEPGLSWDITPNLNFNPYVNIFPFDNAGWNNTTVNFYLTAKFL